MTASSLALSLGLASLAANTALIPLPRPDHVWRNRNHETWIGRHESVKAQAAQGKAQLIFIGDSITHGWEGEGKGHWERHFGRFHPINMGFGGDRIEHVLWRLDNGAVDGLRPKLAVVMIGTNNWQVNTPEEIAEGVEAVCRKIRSKLPSTKILLLAIFPRANRNLEAAKITNAANSLMAKLGDQEHIHFLNINKRFLNAQGKLTRDIMPDLLHPSEEGYRIWAESIMPSVERLMKQ